MRKAGGLTISLVHLGRLADNACSIDQYVHVALVLAICVGNGLDAVLTRDVTLDPTHAWQRYAKSTSAEMRVEGYKETVYTPGPSPYRSYARSDGAFLGCRTGRRSRFALFKVIADALQLLETAANDVHFGALKGVGDGRVRPQAAAATRDEHTATAHAKQAAQRQVRRRRRRGHSGVHRHLGRDVSIGGVCGRVIHEIDLRLWPAVPAQSMVVVVLMTTVVMAIGVGGGEPKALGFLHGRQTPPPLPSSTRESRAAASQALVPSHPSTRSQAIPPPPRATTPATRCTLRAAWPSHCKCLPFRRADAI